MTGSCVKRAVAGHQGQDLCHLTIQDGDGRAENVWLKASRLVLVRILLQWTLQAQIAGTSDIILLHLFACSKRRLHILGAQFVRPNRWRLSLLRNPQPMKRAIRPAAQVVSKMAVKPGTRTGTRSL
jgi:hypothetical protein